MDAPPLEIQMDLQLGQTLVFGKWLPADPADAVVYETADQLAKVRAWIPDETRFRGPFKREGDRNVLCDRARLLIRFRDVADLCESYGVALPQEDGPSCFTDGLAQVSRRVALDCVGRMLEYINEFLEHKYVVRQRTTNVSAFLEDANALWREAPSGSWMNLEYGGTIESNIVLNIPAEEAWIGPEAWASLREYMRGGVRLDITLHFLARSRALLLDGDARSAVVECAVALERELRMAIDQFLKDHSSGRARLVGEFSLGNGIRTWLPLVFPTVLQTEIDAATRIRELRNQILHQAQVTIRPEDHAFAMTTIALVRRLLLSRLPSGY